jgi:uncharacterized membrane protein YGL010W
MALMSNRSWDDWLKQYSDGHRHPANRFCHSVGIPVVVSSIVLAAAACFEPRLWPFAGALFLVGWVFQFVGHAYERKAPEFFRDWRFLFVGLRWWIAKMRGLV